MLSGTVRLKMSTTPAEAYFIKENKMKMTRILSAFMVIAFALFVSGPAAAAELKIGIVDLQKALNLCDAGKKAKEDIKQEAEKLEGELNKEQESLKKLKGELEKNSSVWNAATKEAKEKEFRGRTAEFQKKFMEYGEQLNKRKQETEARIIADLRDIVVEIAKKKGMTFVFERSIGGVVYSPKDVDVTDEVIKAHNSRKK